PFAPQKNELDQLYKTKDGKEITPDHPSFYKCLDMGSVNVERKKIAEEDMAKFSEIIQAILEYCLVELAMEELKKELQGKATTTSFTWWNNKRQENRSGRHLLHEQDTASSSSHDQVLKLLDSLRKMLLVQQQNQDVNAKEINQNGKKNTSISEESPKEDLLSSDKLTSISRKSVGLEVVEPVVVESTSAAAGKAASSASKSKSSSDPLKINKSDPQTSSRAAGSSSDNDTSSEILEDENTTTLAYLTTEFLDRLQSFYRYNGDNPGFTEYWDFHSWNFWAYFCPEHFCDRKKAFSMYDICVTIL
ncbi:unnamed protein product, partial [Amoebophrya sp. A120]